MRVKNWLNAHEFPSVGEINRLPSLTVPDDTMSVREILQRFAASPSTPIPGVKVPMYDPENFYPDVNTLDLSERQEWAERTRAEVRELRESEARNKAEMRRRTYARNNPTQSETPKESSTNPS